MWCVAFVLLILVPMNLYANNLYHEISVASHGSIGVNSGQLTSHVNSGQLKLEYEHSKWAFHFDGRWEYDAVYDWRSEYSNAAEDEYHTRFWLDDAYINWQGNTMDLAIGYQKVVWGQADDLRVVDVVNPLNLKDFVLFDIDEYRISLPMIKLETTLGEWDWQGLSILETEPNQLPPQGSEFPLLPADIDKENQPEDPEYGLRGQTFWSDTDIAIYAFRGHSDNPVFIFPNDETQLSYKRETMWGASASRPIADFVVRSEVAQFVGRSFNDNNGNVVTSDVTQWLIGLDYLYQDWLITAQITDRHIKDWTSAYQANEDEPLYTLSADGRLLSDTVNLRFAVTHADYDGRGQLYQTKLSYQPNQHWQWRAHLDFLSGSSSNFFGQFRDNDRLWLAVKYTF